MSQQRNENSPHPGSNHEKPEGLIKSEAPLKGEGDQQKPTGSAGDEQYPSPAESRKPSGSGKNVHPRSRHDGPAKS